jgi:hypothetical protein
MPIRPPARGVSRRHPARVQRRRDKDPGAIVVERNHSGDFIRPMPRIRKRPAPTSSGSCCDEGCLLACRRRPARLDYVAPPMSSAGSARERQAYLSGRQARSAPRLASDRFNEVERARDSRSSHNRRHLVAPSQATLAGLLRC